MRVLARFPEPPYHGSSPKSLCFSYETGLTRRLTGQGLHMAVPELGRWVSKAEAARELEVSLSTLDRRIRKGEVEVVREGRRVYVRMHGPEYLSDDELLRQAIIREDELERTVRELERERDEAREAASAGRDSYKSWRGRIGRSGPRTEGRDEWLSGWVGP